ncbi:MAG: glycosyltransferase family 2 protein, partial [Actinomycetota bacterium]
PQRSRTAILADLVHDRGGDRLLPQHTFPAVSRLQEATAARVSIDRIDHFGTPPKDPEVSVVVPLYRRIDFVEHQMAHFFHDIQIRSAEIIYVLDSPELTTDLDRMSRQLWALYGVPFTVVTLDRNGGFSAANNLGASAASGRKLLFMNSDVLPERPGWLAEMSSFYDSTDCIGALGPKLVYEDATLQHAGLEFRWSDENRCWLNVHCYQGLHRDFPPAQVPREVPGVTGACLMIDAALYRRVGGMRGMYMQGDFEDSDLCLRLRGMGLANWYLPAVSLFHLEGQSYPSEMRRLAFRYNSWVHTVLWGDRISQIMQSQAEAFPRVSEVFAQSTEVTT